MRVRVCVEKDVVFEDTWGMNNESIDENEEGYDL